MTDFGSLFVPWFLHFGILLVGGFILGMLISKSRHIKRQQLACQKFLGKTNEQVQEFYCKMQDLENKLIQAKHDESLDKVRKVNGEIDIYVKEFVAG